MTEDKSKSLKYWMQPYGLIIIGIFAFDTILEFFQSPLLNINIDNFYTTISNFSVAAYSIGSAVSMIFVFLYVYRGGKNFFAIVFPTIIYFVDEELFSLLNYSGFDFVELIANVMYAAFFFGLTILIYLLAKFAYKNRFTQRVKGSFSKVVLYALMLLVIFTAKSIFWNISNAADRAPKFVHMILGPLGGALPLYFATGLSFCLIVTYFSKYHKKFPVALFPLACFIPFGIATYFTGVVRMLLFYEMDLDYYLVGNILIVSIYIFLASLFGYILSGSSALIPFDTSLVDPVYVKPQAVQMHTTAPQAPLNTVAPQAATSYVNTNVNASITCPNCNARLVANAKFCTSCGMVIEQKKEETVKKRFCTSCGAENKEGDSFCYKCGNRLI